MRISPSEQRVDEGGDRGALGEHDEAAEQRPSPAAAAAASISCAHEGSATAPPGTPSGVALQNRCFMVSGEGPGGVRTTQLVSPRRRGSSPQGVAVRRVRMTSAVGTTPRTKITPITIGVTTWCRMRPTLNQSPVERPQETRAGRPRSRGRKPRSQAPTAFACHPHQGPKRDDRENGGEDEAEGSLGGGFDLAPVEALVGIHCRTLRKSAARKQPRGRRRTLGCACERGVGSAGEATVKRGFCRPFDLFTPN